MKKVKQAIKKENKLKNTLSVITTIVLAILFIINVIKQDLVALCFLILMLTITIIVSAIIHKEDKRRLANLEKMFNKKKKKP